MTPDQIGTIAERLAEDFTPKMHEAALDPETGINWRAYVESRIAPLMGCSICGKDRPCPNITPADPPFFGREQGRHCDECEDWLCYGSEEISELDELRAYARAVDRWLDESDAERNEGTNPVVHVIAPLESQERIVAIARHFLGRKFPHMNDKDAS